MLEEISYYKNLNSDMLFDIFKSEKLCLFTGFRSICLIFLDRQIQYILSGKELFTHLRNDLLSGVKRILSGQEFVHYHTMKKQTNKRLNTYFQLPNIE